jgi:hypothetical protein
VEEFAGATRFAGSAKNAPFAGLVDNMAAFLLVVCR